MPGTNALCKPTSYASAALGRPKVNVSKGPTLDVAPSTSFMIVPDKKSASRLTTFAATKETFCNVFKPADCALRINKVVLAKGNGIRIEAYSPNLERIKSHPGLKKAGLKVEENVKFNPRIVVYGVPANMTPNEI